MQPTAALQGPMLQRFEHWLSCDATVAGMVQQACFFSSPRPQPIVCLEPTCPVSGEVKFPAQAVTSGTVVSLQL
jgi:hypothetical protein